MKKVLSVAMASAMVLGMGANAFAIEYSTGSNDTANWPEGGLKFAGSLFVTDKDGKIVEGSVVDRDSKNNFDFQPGDTIWMPLYAENQKVYVSGVTEGDKGTAAKEEHKVVATVEKNGSAILWRTGDEYYGESGNAPTEDKQTVTDGKFQGNRLQVTNEVKVVNGKVYTKYVTKVLDDTVINEAIKNDNKNRKYYIGGKLYSNVRDWAVAINADNAADAFVTETTEAVKGEETEYGKPIWDGKELAYGHYTGNIDKNWSINLIEKDGSVSDLVEKAELYKADKLDYHSYKGVTDEIQPNAVYLRVTLKDEWKTTKSATMKYYVYVADNKGNESDKVWVSGNYSNNNVKTVNFDWSNDASVASLWKANENGVAVFDFADKAFFTVKMYKGETMYLDLNTAYNKAIEGDFDAEFDSFFKFDNTNANFSREGELVIASGDENLSVYAVTEEGLEPVDAEYVEDYKIAGINRKVDGFKFNTKQLGNYVLAEEIAEEEEVEEEEVAEDEEAEEETAPEAEAAPETNKPNPDTGAEDFVGLAVSLAVVSVAAAGALALKK